MNLDSYPTVWPHHINITDRTDNGPIAQGEPLLVTAKGVRRRGLTGLKPLPKYPRKIIYSFKSGAFYVSQFVKKVNFTIFYNNRLYRLR